MRLFEGTKWDRPPPRHRALPACRPRSLACGSGSGQLDLATQLDQPIGTRSSIKPTGNLQFTFGGLELSFEG
jgi:hypothetical protein